MANKKQLDGLKPPVFKILDDDDSNDQPKDASTPKADAKPKVIIPKVTLPADLVKGERAIAKCQAGTLPDNVIKEKVYLGNPKDCPAAPPYPHGSRLRMHYTATSLPTRVLLDDSRTHPKPIEIIIGKKFKLEIWELAVNTMFLGEVSKFLVPKDYCIFYPTVAKVLRDSLKSGPGVTKSQSCCAQAISGTGYEDLDQFYRDPTDLQFIFELVEVAVPGDYEMESWYMTDEQKAESIGKLQEEGNKFYVEGQYMEAAAKYTEGLRRLEQLLNKESPGSEEMKGFKMKQLPLFLNYAMCYQKTMEYYEAIKYNNFALEIQPRNTKGLFRRGQCYMETGYYAEARADFQLVMNIDKTLTKSVKKELLKCEKAEGASRADEVDRCRRMLRQQGPRARVEIIADPQDDKTVLDQQELVNRLLKVKINGGEKAVKVDSVPSLVSIAAGPPEENNTEAKSTENKDEMYQDQQEITVLHKAKWEDKDYESD